VQSVAADEIDIAAVHKTAGTGMLSGIVLPRFLRRPARVLEKLAPRLPRHLGVKGSILLFLATAVAGVAIGGHAVTMISAVTAWSGLAIDEIKITGQSKTSEVDVLDRLQLGSLPSLFTFDAEAAKARVETLPWVRDATLKKLYPDTLEVVISERVPFALWQNGAAIAMVDEAGRVLGDQVDERYADLPLVVGPGAGERAGEFIGMVAAFPAIAERVHAGVLIAGRRWTVVLDDGVELMLPEYDPAAALRTIADLDAEKGLLSRHISAVDVRMGDRVIVRLDEDGVIARKAMLRGRTDS